MLVQLTEKSFLSGHDVTIGVEFGIYDMEIDGHNVRLQIWDTCGQESFKAITRTYYRGAQGVLLVYDVTRRETFAYLEGWISECTDNADDNVTILLVGNKADLEGQRAVSYEEGKAFAEERNMQFLEASAKTSQNVEEAFRKSALVIYEKFKNGQISLDTNESIKGTSLRRNKSTTSLRKNEKTDKCCN
uniref:Uncharacterized protein n=1 Tax=Arcella intermedia TaxID=1963864 RepID=A0A6B2LIL0_9EUKA